MGIFTRSREQPYVYTWESEPFVFQPGLIYVIEFDVASTELKDMQELAQFFRDNGVLCKLVPSRGGKALNPIKVQRKKENS